MAEAGAGLKALGEAERRAHFITDRTSDLLHALLVDLDDLGEQVHAFLALCQREGRKGPPRRGNGLVYVRFGTQGNFIERLLVCRIDHRNRLFVGRVLPRSIDVEFAALHHGCHPYGVSPAILLEPRPAEGNSWVRRRRWGRGGCPVALMPRRRAGRGPGLPSSPP